MTEQNPNEIVKSKISAGETGLQLRSLDDMFRFAQYAIKSCLVPEGFKSPEQVLIAIQAGAELSLPPMKALSSICVVKGRPTLWGDTALGLVRNSGLIEYCNEYFEVDGKKVDEKSLQYEKIDLYPATLAAVCETKRHGEPEPVKRYFSVADAKLAGLWKKSGPWTTHPKRMLKYKARAFNLRDTFPDILCGMHLTEEFMGETVAAPANTVLPRDERRKPVASVVTEPVPQAVATPEPAQPVVDVPATVVAEPPIYPNEPSEGPAEDSLPTEASASPAPEPSEHFEPVAYSELVGMFGTLNNIAGQEANEKFLAWAAYVLLVEEAEIDAPEKFTQDMLDHLLHELENFELPQEEV